ncbi:hypothetical protein LA345_38120 (plasmid) [Burkholderia vietnamiensis]|nr:hypothetical protein [Burkholderia vietnamiensis]
MQTESRKFTRHITGDELIAACDREGGVNKVSANSYHRLYGYKDCGDHYELTQ